jgi:hypothetical protein
MTDKRLSEKFEVLAMLWSEDESAPGAIQNKDWNSVMDAVQKDITGLSNDYKYKRLIKMLDELYENKGNQNMDMLYFVDKFRNDTGPWMEIARKIQKDIQNAD